MSLSNTSLVSYKLIYIVFTFYNRYRPKKQVAVSIYTLFNDYIGCPVTSLRYWLSIAASSCSIPDVARWDSYGRQVEQSRCTSRVSDTNAGFLHQQSGHIHVHKTGHTDCAPLQAVCPVWVNRTVQHVCIHIRIHSGTQTKIYTLIL